MTRPRNRRPGARSSAAASGRRSSRRAPSSSSNSQAVIVGVGVVAVLAVVFAVFAFSGGDKTPAGDGAGSSGTTAPAKTPQPARSQEPASTAGAGLPGKTPDRPAPSIAAVDLEQAEQHYRNGVAKWNEGQKARSAGDSTRYAAALQEAFDEFEALRDALRTYTDWFEEADLEGWAMPAEYVDLQRRLDTYDRDYQKVKKLKQAR